MRSFAWWELDITICPFEVIGQTFMHFPHLTQVLKNFSFGGLINLG